MQRMNTKNEKKKKIIHFYRLFKISIQFASYRQNANGDEKCYCQMEFIRIHTSMDAQYAPRDDGYLL